VTSVLLALAVDGHQDLPSDGHEVDATAITESNRIRWSSRRGICSERCSYVCQWLGWCFSSLISGAGNVALAGAAGCGQDREGPLRVEGRLLLEIMRRFVALPWVRKRVPSRRRPGADRRRRGFPRFGGAGRGGRCTVVLACRRSSPFDLGPFEAAY
jgi:hypothetical protein